MAEICSSLIVVDHPLIRHKLTLLRCKDTPTPLFRALMKEVGCLLTIEATRSLPLEEVDIETPVRAARGVRLAAVPLVVPILRAGLGLADGVLAAMPEADVAHVGVYRDEETLHPVEYLERLPRDVTGRPVLVVDPMLATGNSSVYVIKLLLAHGASVGSMVFVSLVAAPEGVKTLAAAYPGLRIVTAALDEGLNDSAYIVPGLGDAGDRLYGTLER
ncbi:uracil phosphoribosyltransferase [Oleispirillum naphthae]|uniref:uracil phosphoribosyltransferase n=1 Tax=Oleispirillum naphthae TaxID=2838853 RepID=UPI00308266DF